MTVGGTIGGQREHQGVFPVDTARVVAPREWIAEGWQADTGRGAREKDSGTTGQRG
jgi:hypothetical protein